MNRMRSSKIKTLLLMIVFSHFIPLEWSLAKPDDSRSLETLTDGRWDQVKTVCYNSQLGETTKTTVMPLLLARFYFEPESELTIYSIGGRRFIQKSVKEDSCKLFSDSQTRTKQGTDHSARGRRFFMQSTFEVALTEPSVRENSVSFVMKSVKERPTISDIINPAVDNTVSCGPEFLGKAIEVMSGYKFPDYLVQEASRKYQLSVYRDSVTSKIFLTLQYNDPHICRHGDVMTTYKLLEN